ncbi:MAG: DUF1330 domain-containing protein [Pusillimonas sp.]
MAGYIIVDINVTDAKQYEVYKRLGSLATEKYGGVYLTRGGKVETLEGNWRPSRVVVLRFDSFEKAKEWYASYEYELAIQARKGASISNVIVCEGLEA